MYKSSIKFISDEKYGDPIRNRVAFGNERIYFNGSFCPEAGRCLLWYLLFYRSLFMNKEILFMATEATVRNHNILAVVGSTSVKALQSSAKTQWAASA